VCLTNIHLKETFMAHKLPKQLETERMILRLASPDEAVTINNAIHETADILKKYLKWAHPTPDVANTLEHINAVISDAEKKKAWRTFMYDKVTGEFIGNCGFHDLDFCRAEFGYWCRSSKQGNGYITEAVDAITKFGFEELGLKRIEIKYVKENIASASVAKRCSYEYESEAPHYFVPYTETDHAFVTTVKFNPSLHEV
jgi:ribosomal-protein-serine acetyltransferase